MDSLIFNNEVDSYETWVRLDLAYLMLSLVDLARQTLFLIFASILVLICGVVLLTLKKPEPKKSAPALTEEDTTESRAHRRKTRGTKKHDREDDEISLTEQGGGGEARTWELGHDSDSDDEDIQDVNRITDPVREDAAQNQRRQLPAGGPLEAHGLMSQAEDGDDHDDYFGEYASAPTK